MIRLHPCLYEYKKAFNENSLYNITGVLVATEWQIHRASTVTGLLWYSCFH